MSESFGNRHLPTEIKVKKAEKCLEISFEDGARFVLAAELLRVESPSAEVQGHGPGEKTLVAGRAEVGIMAVEPVGNYAIKIVFDDLHDSGIYTWDYLYALGNDQERLLADYVQALQAAGLSRDPRAVQPVAAAKGGGGCGRP